MSTSSTKWQIYKQCSPSLRVQQQFRRKNIQRHSITYIRLRRPTRWFVTEHRKLKRNHKSTRCRTNYEIWSWSPSLLYRFYVKYLSLRKTRDVMHWRCKLSTKKTITLHKEADVMGRINWIVKRQLPLNVLYAWTPRNSQEQWIQWNQRVVVIRYARQALLTGRRYHQQMKMKSPTIGVRVLCTVPQNNYHRTVVWVNYDSVR